MHRKKSLGNFHASEDLMKKGRNAVHEKGGRGTRLTKEKEVKKKKKKCNFQQKFPLKFNILKRLLKSLSLMETKAANHCVT